MSDRVKYAMERVSQESGRSAEEVLKEAKSVLDELGHALTMKGVRFLAIALIKVFKALFKRIYVNEAGIERLRGLLQDYPILLMPTHRSYMDFLLVSFIMFDNDLPLPVIAAAMDFSNMKFMGTLLRMCGAFYIRRSFGSDTLYWAIFTEYVQCQLRNGDAPIEFFVEGTRSRTGKSYQPRIGMLSAALESYFKAEVPDVMIVPISISYERILEESLYAFEMLGIPKPKESTSGMLKARSILEEDFGSVHIYVAEPISIRHLSNNHVDRGIHALEPRYINNLTNDEQKLVQKLAYLIIEVHHRHMVISPWSVITSVLMQSGEGISLAQLVKEAEWLRRQALNYGGLVDWPGDASAESVVTHNLQLHANVVSLSKDGLVQMKIVRPNHVKQAMTNDIMLNAATDLLLASYRNQLLHLFVRPGLVALCVNGCSQETLSMSELFERYCFLEQLFSQDFVFQPGATRVDFDLAVQNLQHCSALVIHEERIHIKESLNKHTTFLSQMLEPFLLGYWVLCQHLLSLTLDVHGRTLPKRPGVLARDAQQLGVALLRDGVLQCYEALSLDLLTNGINALARMKAMHRDKREDQPWLSPDMVALSAVVQKMHRFMELPSVEMSNYTKRKDPKLIAKM